MKNLKFISQYYYIRKPFRVLLWFLPFFYYGHHWMVTYQRKIFKRKIDEREYEIKLKFQEFTESFSLNETTVLKEFKTEKDINLDIFQNHFLIVFYGDLQHYINLFKEFEEVTINTIKNVKFLYILESDAAKSALLKFPQFLKDYMVIAYIPDNNIGKNFAIKKNNIYVVSPEYKFLYSKQIVDEYIEKKHFNRIIKDINLKIRKEGESKFIKSFQF